MTYFNSRELAAASLFASLWGVLNAVFSPVVFQAFGLPILCDMLGFAALSLTFWWVRKFGAATVVGFVATLINFILNPGGLFFLGFTAASIVFDVAASSIGYKRVFRNSRCCRFFFACNFNRFRCNCRSDNRQFFHGRTSSSQMGRSLWMGRTSRSWRGRRRIDRSGCNWGLYFSTNTRVQLQELRIARPLL